MVRYLSWLANAALLTLGCFLVANTANAVFAALLTPSPAERASAPAPEPPTQRSWSARQKILDRNLFNASLLAPAPTPVDIDPDLEETRLPLELLGTVAAADSRLSWAAIEDKETRKHLVLRVNDDLKDGAARVMGIEAKRVVLSENGELRELVFAENEPPAAPPNRTPRKPRAGRRRPVRPRPPAPPAELEQNVLSPAELLSQLNILPKYQDGEMVGVQVNTVEPGSFFEEAGLKSGDVITEINGIPINNPEESPVILRELSEAPTLIVKTEHGVLEIPMPGR